MKPLLNLPMAHTPYNLPLCSHVSIGVVMMLVIRVGAVWMICGVGPILVVVVVLVEADSVLDLVADRLVVTGRGVGTSGVSTSGVSTGGAGGTSGASGVVVLGAAKLVADLLGGALRRVGSSTSSLFKSESDVANVTSLHGYVRGRRGQ